MGIFLSSGAEPFNLMATSWLPALARRSTDTDVQLGRVKGADLLKKNVVMGGWYSGGKQGKQGILFFSSHALTAFFSWDR